MKTRSLILGLAFIPTIASANNLTLYNNIGFYENEKETDKAIFYISTPNSVLNNTFIVINDNEKINKIEFQNNNFTKTLRENINQEITINNEQFTLTKVYPGFLVVKKSSNPEEIETYYKISDIKTYKLQTQIPLNESIFKIYLKDNIKKPQNIKYAYAFNGMQWYGNHKIIIDQNKKLQYQSKITIQNDTDVDYKHTQVSLMAGDVNINDRQSSHIMRTYAADSMIQSSSMEQANFEGFAGFQKMDIPYKLTINSHTITEYDYKDYKSHPYEKIYNFSSLQPNNQKIEDLKPNMTLTLLRNDNKKYQSPFVKGKTSIYQENDKNKLVLLSHTSVNNHSSDQDVNFNIGQAFDVYLSYKSNKTNQEIENLSYSNYVYINKIYNFDINITNNEKNKVIVAIPFSGSVNTKKPKRYTIPAQTTVTKTISVKYREKTLKKTDLELGNY